jgi:hypothetical protein
MCCDDNEKGSLIAVGLVILAVGGVIGSIAGHDEGLQSRKPNTGLLKGFLMGITFPISVPLKVLYNAYHENYTVITKN